MTIRRGCENIRHGKGAETNQEQRLFPSATNHTSGLLNRNSSRQEQINERNR